jgi:hypothetical protein
MDKDTKDILDALNFIKERMLTKDEGATKEDLTRFATKEDLARFATKEDLARLATKEEVRLIVREEVSDIHSELAALRRELEELGAKVDNVTQFRKEIDHALERIAAIEKHLGINRKIAA